jgi:hypothetical protein
MIPNIFNPKINNKVVEKTCLSNLKAKYHIAQCFLFPNLLMLHQKWQLATIWFSQASMLKKQG